MDNIVHVAMLLVSFHWCILASISASSKQSLSGHIISLW